MPVENPMHFDVVALAQTPLAILLPQLLLLLPQRHRGGVLVVVLRRGTLLRRLHRLLPQERTRLAQLLVVVVHGRRGISRALLLPTEVLRVKLLTEARQGVLVELLIHVVLVGALANLVLLQELLGETERGLVKGRATVGGGWWAW